VPEYECFALLNGWHGSHHPVVIPAFTSVLNKGSWPSQWSGLKWSWPSRRSGSKGSRTCRSGYAQVDRHALLAWDILDGNGHGGYGPREEDDFDLQGLSGEAR